jgi:hypothetical protein
MNHRWTLVLWMSVVLTPTCSNAQVDCDKLDPRAAVTTSVEGQVKASADTLFKIAKASGDIGGKFRQEIDNLQRNVPVSEAVQVRVRALYLFCGMVANATDISTDRKFEMYRMMESRATRPSLGDGKKRITKATTEKGTKSITPKKDIGAKAPTEKVDTGSQINIPEPACVPANLEPSWQVTDKRKVTYNFKFRFERSASKVHLFLKNDCGGELDSRNYKDFSLSQENPVASIPDDGCSVRAVGTLELRRTPSCADTVVYMNGKLVTTDGSEKAILNQAVGRVSFQDPSPAPVVPAQVINKTGTLERVVPTRDCPARGAYIEIVDDATTRIGLVGTMQGTDNGAALVNVERWNSGSGEWVPVTGVPIEIQMDSRKGIKLVDGRTVHLSVTYKGIPSGKKECKVGYSIEER